MGHATVPEEPRVAELRLPIFLVLFVVVVLVIVLLVSVVVDVSPIGVEGVVRVSHDLAVVAGEPTPDAVDDPIPPAALQLRDNLNNIALVEAQARAVVGLVVVEGADVHDGLRESIHLRRGSGSGGPEGGGEWGEAGLTTGAGARGGRGGPGLGDLT
jgi:hypothetical protein